MVVGWSVQTHTALFAHLSAGFDSGGQMSKHVRPGQKPPCRKRENCRPAQEQLQPQVVSDGHLVAALGGFSFGRELEEREAQKSNPRPSRTRGTESWVRRSDWGSSEKAKQALKVECVARVSHLERREGPSRCERRSIFGKQLLKP